MEGMKGQTLKKAQLLRGKPFISFDNFIYYFLPPATVTGQFEARNPPKIRVI